jgi:spermidine/putrescine transport system substrate-binding protein
VPRSNRFAFALRELTAIFVAIALLGACGIAAQSPTPGATSTPAATPTAGAGATATAGGSPTATAGSTASASPSVPPTATLPATPQPTLAGKVRWDNWPAYMAVDDDGNFPILDAFKEKTGIDWTYDEKINDNSEMFATMEPDLAAGRSVGYDVITPSDWMVAKLIRLGYLQPLDKSLLPNFTANAQELFLNPWYDPGNTYSIPWQSGIVGIGYNAKLTGREITKFDDLLDPAFNGQVGLFSEMIDTMCLTILSMGKECKDATLEDAQAAQQKLLPAAQAGQFEDFYGNDYYDALALGNIALTMAWSGDISQMQLNDNPDVKFVVPDTGGLLFVDNMVMPKVVDHPADAYALMDYWYTLDAAVPLTEYIGYYSPVKGVREAIVADAQEYRDAGDDEDADYYEQVARDSFPDQGQLENVHEYKQLTTEEDERQWNDLFNEVVISG